MRLRHGQRGELDVPRLAEAFRCPAPELLRSRGVLDRRQRKRRVDDRETDTRTAPEELLDHQRYRQAGRILAQLRIEERAVEPRLSGLLEHRPGETLIAVVFRRDRADHLRRKAMRSVDQLMLLFGQFQRESHVITHTDPCSRSYW